MAPPSRAFTLHSCGCRFDIHCSSDDTARLIDGVFGALAVTAPMSAPARREYYIDSVPGGAYRVTSAGETFELADANDLLFHLDKSIIIELQHARPDLFFVHAAALGWKGRVAILSAPAGTGKSTLTLVALQRGFDYLSDELAPIDLQDLTVHPYPRAPYLKSPPPLPHVLPGGALNHGGRYHIPMMPRATPRDRAVLAALIFVRRGEERFSGLRPISAASGATRLISNTLNLLSHPAAGIDAAAALSRAVRSFEIDSTDLTAASEAIMSAL